MIHSAQFRIGVVSYANTVPLCTYLPEILPHAHIRYDIPSNLAKQLSSGELDVALLSSIELLRHPEYGFIPGIGICSDGVVQSVRLFSRKNTSQLKTVSLDGASLSSSMMTRILFAEHWKNTPSFSSSMSPLVKRLEDADAALTIGYPYLEVDDPSVRVIDMGQAWYEYCQLPFIYALWITRPVMDVDLLIEPFEAAKRQGLANLDKIAREYSELDGLPVEKYESFFQQNIYYDIRERERAGLDFFFEKAQAFWKDNS